MDDKNLIYDNVIMQERDFHCTKGHEWKAYGATYISVAPAVPICFFCVAEWVKQNALAIEGPLPKEPTNG